jgi:hypothetical protein
MYSDLHHIFPVDQYVNGTGHNNYPFGTVTMPAAYTSLNGSKRGNCSYPGYSGVVFEPRDEYKGDFARAYFYMATCYQNQIAGWYANDANADAILDGSSYPAFEIWFKNLLLDWNAADIVSAKEVARNDSVYKIQGNRNPYIDHPEYVEAVWMPGGLKSEPDNHPTSFVSVLGSPSYSSIQLNWIDASGTVLPDGYLIKGSTVSYADISDPIDGIAIADGGLNKNVVFGSQSYTFTGLNGSTTYYFKIYPYSNSGVNIDFKTAPTIQITSNSTTAGSSTLQPGDIAFIGIGTDNPDKFAFITLTNVAGGTVINFTDNPWNGTVLTSNEQTCTWTAPAGGLVAGSVVSMEGSVVTGGGTLVGSLTTLAVDGDQILAYQGIASSPNFIAGISTTGWISTGVPTSNQSYKPANLVTKATEVSFTSEMDNEFYSGPLTLADGSAFNFICNGTNWTRDNAIQVFPAWTFNIGNTTTVNVNSTVQNLTVNSGETLTIPVGKQLTVQGVLANNAGTGGIVIESDGNGTGSLLHNSNFVPATVNSFIGGTSYAWHLLSSPVSQTIDGTEFVPSGSGYDFYCWDEPNEVWVNYKTIPEEPSWESVNGSDFIPGRGYLVAYEALNQTKQFVGLLNNGQVDFELNYTNTSTWKGYNLAGNPYPTAIDWKATNGWTRSKLFSNGGGNDIWIWKESAGNYGAYNSATISDIGTNGVTRYISTGQGFLVLAGAGGYLSMNNEVRVHQNPAYLKTENGVSNLLRLGVRGMTNAYTDEVIIEFGHEGMNGGTMKNYSFWGNAPSLYVKDGIEKRSIDFLGNLDKQTVNVCLEPGSDGIFTLTADELESFTDGVPIVLEDVKIGMKQDLMVQPEYSFFANSGDDPNRFLLHFGGTIGVNESKKTSKLSVHSKDGQIFVLLPDEVVSGELSVFTLLGQSVCHKFVEGEKIAKISVNGSCGYYVVQLVTKDRAYVGKVFVD